jgi:hypothetical protein
MFADTRNVVPATIRAGSCVAVLSEKERDGTALVIELNRDMFPVPLVLKPEKSVVIGVEEPVLDVSRAAFARIHVYVRFPVARVYAATSDDGRECVARASEARREPLARRTFRLRKTRDQPPDRGRPIEIGFVENHNRSVVFCDFNLPFVKNSVAIRVLFCRWQRRPGGARAEGKSDLSMPAEYRNGECEGTGQ